MNEDIVSVNKNEQLTNKSEKKKDVFDTKNVVMKLENYMDRVTEKDCSPATVQAAVACADKIVDILRLHIDLERLNVKKSQS